jgi:hypothetical protein
MGRVAGPGRLGNLKKVKDSLKSKASSVKNVPSENSITVRFLENPEEWHGYYEHYSDEDGYHPCVEGDCDSCQSDNPEIKRRAFRYLANGYVVDDQRVWPIKMPKSLVEQLVNYYEKKGTLLDRDYELSKSGSGKNNTKYMASPDAPSNMNLKRFESKMFDLDEVLEKMVDGDEPEDDEPVSSKKKSKKSRRHEVDDDDDDDDDPWEDDDDDDDDDDDEDDEPIRRKKKSSTKKPTAKRKVSSSKKPVKKTVSKKKRR